MNLSKLILLTAVFQFVAATSTARAAAAPSTLSYQAVLLTSGGQPVTTPVPVVFTIYDATTDGTALWTETRNVTPDAAGRISIDLGDTSPISESVFDGPDRWLGIKVGADLEMPQRAKLAASAYSRRVSTIDGAAGGTLDGNLTLKSTAAFEKDLDVAQPAQLTLISLSGDTIVVGPADQLVFRATNPSGAEVMSATVLGVNGPTLSIRDPGGNVSEHVAASSAYFGSSAKNADALQKRLEIGADGISVFGDGGEILAHINPSTGQVATTSINVSPNLVASLNKEAMACGDGNPSDLGPITSQNNAVGPDNNLGSAISSFAVGKCNTISSATSTAFGRGNDLSGDNSVSIGDSNIVAGASSVAIGKNNYVQVEAPGSIALGDSNRVTYPDDFAIGFGNYVAGPRSGAFGRYNSVYGGGDNFVFGESSHTDRVGDGVIGGGIHDTAIWCNAPVIAGGDRNRIIGSSASVNENFWSTIGGGSRNSIDITSDAFPNPGRGTIAGGVNNLITRTYGTIGGGQENSVTGYTSTVAGGVGNVASGSAAFIGGGAFHIASGDGSVVCGGGENSNFAENNRATGTGAFIGGGRRNRATGISSICPGGYASEANGDYSLAAGRRAKANHSGTLVWADGTDADFSSTAVDQFLIRAGGNVGINTNTPSQPLTVAGTVYSTSGGFKFPDGSVQSSAASSITDGWADDGGVVRLSTGSDFVGIGTSSPSEKLHVDGNLRVSGTIYSGTSTISIDGTNEIIKLGSDPANQKSFGGIGYIFDGTDAGVSRISAKLSGGGSEFLMNSPSGTNAFQIKSDATAVMKIADSNNPGDTVSFGPPDTVFDLKADGTSRMSANMGATGPEIAMNAATGTKVYSVKADATAVMKIADSNNPGDTVSFGPPDTVFDLKADGTLRMTARQTASGPTIEMNGPSGGRTLTLASGKVSMPITEGLSARTLEINTSGIMHDSTGTAAFGLNAKAGVYISNNPTSGVSTVAGRLINTSSGAYLSTGGTWTNASDRSLKENFSPVSSGEILDKIARLSITEWNYKVDGESVRHVGPTAQDFRALFGLGTDDKSISTIDPSGVALAAIQALNEKLNEQKSENDELRSQIAELREMIRAQATHAK